MPMALTAEKLAEQYRITQDEVDEFSVLSQRRTAEAQAAGRFRDEIAPVEIETRKGKVLFEKDEHPRPETTVEGSGSSPGSSRRTASSTPARPAAWPTARP